MKAETSVDARQQAADDFLSIRPALLRGAILTLSIATLDGHTDDERRRLLGQLDLLTNAGSAPNLEAAAKDLVNVYFVAGGDQERLARMLGEAQATAHPAWINEVRTHVVVASLQQFSHDVLPNQVVAEIALEALAIVVSIPTGPLSALLLAARLLETFGS